MADLSSDYVSLELPDSVDPAVRTRIINTHGRLLKLLNTPGTPEEQKKVLRQAMHALHKEVSGLGGRVDVEVKSQQSDPTTGEAFPNPKPPQPNMIQSPVAPQDALAAFAQLGSSPSSPLGEGAVGGAGRMFPAPTPTSPGKAPLPPISAQTPEEAAALAKLRDAGVKPGGALPADFGGAPSAPAAISPMASDSTAALSPSVITMEELRNRLGSPNPRIPTHFELPADVRFAAGLLAATDPEYYKAVVLPVLEKQRTNALQQYALELDQRTKGIGELGQLAQLQQAEETIQLTREKIQAATAKEQGDVMGALRAMSAQTMGLEARATEAASALEIDGQGEQAKALRDQVAAIRTTAGALALGGVQVGAKTLTALQNQVNQANQSIGQAFTRAGRVPPGFAVAQKEYRDLRNLKNLIEQGQAILAEFPGLTGPVDQYLWAHIPPFTLSPRKEMAALRKLESISSTITSTMATTESGGKNLTETELQIFGGRFPLMNNLGETFKARLNQGHQWFQTRLDTLEMQFPDIRKPFGGAISGVPISNNPIPSNFVEDDTFSVGEEP